MLDLTPSVCVCVCVCARCLMLMTLRKVALLALRLAGCLEGCSKWAQPMCSTAFFQGELIAVI